MLNGGGMRNGSGVIVNESQRSTTYHVARSGGWVMHAGHMEIGSSGAAADSIRKLDSKHPPAPFTADSGRPPQREIL